LPPLRNPRPELVLPGNVPGLVYIRIQAFLRLRNFLVGPADGDEFFAIIIIPGSPGGGTVGMITKTEFMISTFNLRDGSQRG